MPFTPVSVVVSSTITGTTILSVVSVAPLPSCPLLLSPTAYTMPLASISKWLLPAAIAVATLFPPNVLALSSLPFWNLTWIGYPLETFVPSPSWLYVLSPHVQTVPSAFRAAWKFVPAASDEATMLSILSPLTVTLIVPTYPLRLFLNVITVVPNVLPVGNTVAVLPFADTVAIFGIDELYWMFAISSDAIFCLSALLNKLKPIMYCSYISDISISILPVLSIITLDGRGDISSPVDVSSLYTIAFWKDNVLEFVLPTCTGVFTKSTVTVPSWPKALSPHAHT